MSKHTCDFNEKLAKVMMANSADASEEEALWALQESGESVSGAIALLGDKKPRATKTTATNLKTTNDSNEDLQYIPDVAVGQNSRSMVAKLPPTSKDDEYICTVTILVKVMIWTSKGCNMLQELQGEAEIVMRMMNQMKRATK
jgi:hypothetical protein